MAENYDDIDKKTPDTVDTDGHASDDKDNDDDYEKYCYLCRRPESVAGKLIHMPGDINICADCMQRSFDSFNNSGFGNMPGLGNMQFIDLTNMPFGNIDMSKFKAQNDVPKSQKVKKKAPKEKKQEEELRLLIRSRLCWTSMLWDRNMPRRLYPWLYTIIIRGFSQIPWMI